MALIRANLFRNREREEAEWRRLKRIEKWQGKDPFAAPEVKAVVQRPERQPVIDPDPRSEGPMGVRPQERRKWELGEWD